MRIALITATFPPSSLGGIGNVAYHNAVTLSKRGHAVSVFTGASSSEKQTSTHYPFSIVYLPTWLRVGNASLTPNMYGMLRGFEVIHLHYPFIFGGEIAWAASRFHKIPLIVTYHNRLEASRGIRRAFFPLYNRLWEQRILSQARIRIAVSQDHIGSLYPDRSAWQEVPNGVDTSLFTPQGPRVCRDQLGATSADFLLLFVGVLDQAHWSKNLDGLIEAMTRTNARTVLWVIGDGDLRAGLERKVQTLRLQRRVKFLGAQWTAQLPEFYRAVDATVVPSLRQESFGLVAIESLACGTPVIASSLPGVRRVVDDGRDGVLFPPGSVVGLSGAIGHLASLEASTRRCMGMLGRSKVIARYSLEGVGETLNKLVDGIPRQGSHLSPTVRNSRGTVLPR